MTIKGDVIREVYVPEGYMLIKEEQLDQLLINTIENSEIPKTLLNSTIDANAELFKKVMEGLKEDVEWMEKHSKNITDFKTKIDLYTQVNPMQTEKNLENLLEAVKKIGGEFETSVKGLPVGGTKELTKEIIRDRATTYMNNIGDDVRGSIKNILEQSINNEKGMRYARDEMYKNIDSMSRNRAEVIARTETVNARNQAELLKAQDSGKEYFIVISAADCCDECFDAYDGNVFHLPEDEDMLPPLHPNCYSKDTEVFTSNGWKLFKDVTKEDLILSLNPKTHETEFIPFTEKVSYHYVGEMYHFHNRWFDMQITPDHEMFVEKRVDHGKKGRSIEPFFIKPSELHGEHKILRKAEYSKESPKYIDINGLRFKPEDYAFFMAWFIAEGSVLHDKNVGISRAYPIKISQHNKEHRKLLEERLKEIYDSVGLKLSVQKEGFETYSRELYEYLHPLGRSHEKYIPEEVFQLSREHLNIFLDNYVKADGHERVCDNHVVQNSSEKQVFTSSKRLADDLSYLILLAGYCPSFHIDKNKGKEVEFANGTYTTNHDLTRISLNKSKYAQVSGMSVDLVPYEDMVYCLELPKWHTLWIKSKNKISWGGNCRCTASFFRSESLAEGMAGDISKPREEEE